MTYASNRDGNSIIVDAQEWEELQALVKRQRVIIDRFTKCFNPSDGWDIDIAELSELYHDVQDTTSMTGASEK